MKLTACALVLLLSLPTLATAGTEDPAATVADAPSPWRFEIVPYAWIPGSGGTIDVHDRSATFDVGVGDVIELLVEGDVLAGAGYFGARYDRWFAYVDAFGAYLKQGASEEVPIRRFCCVSLAATGRVRPVIVDVGVGYQLGEWTLPQRLRPVSLGAYVGVRYTHLGVDLSAAAVAGRFQRQAAASDEFNWADPMLGVRGEIPVLDRVSLAYRGDVGGFGVSSDLIWSVTGDIRYWFEWSPWPDSTQLWLGLGWRIVSFDNELSATSRADMRLSGPTAGLGFAF